MISEQKELNISQKTYLTSASTEEVAPEACQIEQKITITLPTSGLNRLFQSFCRIGLSGNRWFGVQLEESLSCHVLGHFPFLLFPRGQG